MCSAGNTDNYVCSVYYTGSVDGNSNVAYTEYGVCPVLHVNVNSLGWKCLTVGHTYVDEADETTAYLSDVNDDGKVTAVDMNILSKYISGLIRSFT